MGPTSTVYGRQIQTAADYQGMPIRARMQSGKRVAYRLYSWRSEGSALADVEVGETFLLVLVLHGGPHVVLVALGSTLCQRVHSSVGDILAVV